MRIHRWVVIAVTSVVTATTVVVGSAQAAYATDFYAEIHNRNSGKCVNVQYDSSASGAWIQQYHCDHTPAVKFRIVDALIPTTPRSYAIVGQSSNKCVQPLDPATYLGDPLVQEDCTLSWAQQWELRAATGGSFQIVNAYSGMCIDVPNWSTDDWVVLQQWTCVPDAANQEFFLENG